MGFLSDLVSNPIGTLTGSDAARRQANRAANQASRALMGGYAEGAPYLTPFTDPVPGLLSQLLTGQLDLQADPGYRARLSQGLEAVQNRFAASGSPFSGAAARALNDYAQGQAAGEYGARYGRLSDLLRLGYGASGDLLDARLRAAGAQAGNLYGAGQFAGRATMQGYAQAQDFARSLLPLLLA